MTFATTLWLLGKSSFKVIFSPWYITHESVAELLDPTFSSDGVKTISPTNDTFTTLWIDRKLAELSFVGLTCALLAGVVAAAFSWQELNQLAWLTKGLWYGSLIVDLTSICLATQQSLALHRICCHRDKCERVRNMLSRSLSLQTNNPKPDYSQLYVWQASIMLLNIGVISFISGLGIQVVANLSREYSPDDIKTFVVVLVAGLLSFFVYLSSSTLLYSRLSSS